MRAQPRIEVFDFQGHRVALITRPRRLRLRAGFGAEPAWLEVLLNPQDAEKNFEHGYDVKTWLNGTLSFKGKISRIRCESRGTRRAFEAVRQPRLDLSEAIVGVYSDGTVTDILAGLMSSLRTSPVTFVEEYPSQVRVDRLEFVNTGLFYAVDLLAKLAGNYLWDLSWENALRFRPPSAPADRVVYYRPRRHRLRVWTTSSTVKNYFLLFGGITGENEFRREFACGESIERIGLRRDSLFVRPIKTEGTYQLLQEAVLAELPHPGTEKHLDFFEGRPDIGAGDRVEIREMGGPGREDCCVFRVREVEQRVGSDGELRTRLHLARGLESATRYQLYIDHDPDEDPSLFVERRVGPFRLDFSALDSAARLDT
jgi:hypothetical protein